MTTTRPAFIDASTCTLCTRLYKKLLDRLLQTSDLRRELRSLYAGYGASNDGPGHSASASECDFGRNEHVVHVLKNACAIKYLLIGAFCSLNYHDQTNEEEDTDTRMRARGAPGRLESIYFVPYLRREAEDGEGLREVRYLPP